MLPCRYFQTNNENFAVVLQPLSVIHEFNNLVKCASGDILIEVELNDDNDWQFAIEEISEKLGFDHDIVHSFDAFFDALTEADIVLKNNVIFKIAIRCSFSDLKYSQYVIDSILRAGSFLSHSRAHGLAVYIYLI